MVDENCIGCDIAISGLAAFAVSASDSVMGDAVVLSPRQADSRVSAPLQLTTDDELYRALYPGKLPALFLVDATGSPTLLGTVGHLGQVEDLLESALATEVYGSP
jgi:hypothetical protein